MKHIVKKSEIYYYDYYRKDETVAAHIVKDDKKNVWHIDEWRCEGTFLEHLKTQVGKKELVELFEYPDLCEPITKREFDRVVKAYKTFSDAIGLDFEKAFDCEEYISSDDED